MLKEDNDIKILILSDEDFSCIFINGEYISEVTHHYDIEYPLGNTLRYIQKHNLDLTKLRIETVDIEYLDIPDDFWLEDNCFLTRDEEYYFLMGYEAQAVEKIKKRVSIDNL